MDPERHLDVAAEQLDLPVAAREAGEEASHLRLDAPLYGHLRDGPHEPFDGDPVIPLVDSLRARRLLEPRVVGLVVLDRARRTARQQQRTEHPLASTHRHPPHAFFSASPEITRRMISLVPS